MFVSIELEEFNNYIILPDLQNLSDYASLSVSIALKEKFIQEKK